jgi:hypothetical protein
MQLSLDSSHDGELIRRHADVVRDLEDAEAILAMMAKHKDSEDPRVVDAYSAVYLLMEEVRQNCLHRLGWHASRTLGHRAVGDTTDGVHELR